MGKGYQSGAGLIRAIALSCVSAMAGAGIAWGFYVWRDAGTGVMDSGSLADWIAALATLGIGYTANRIAKTAADRARSEDAARQRRDVEGFERRVKVLVARAYRATRQHSAFVAVGDDEKFEEMGFDFFVAKCEALAHMLETLVWSTEDFALVSEGAQSIMGDMELTVMIVRNGKDALMRSKEKFGEDSWKGLLDGLLSSLLEFREEARRLELALNAEIAERRAELASTDSSLVDH